MKIDKKQEQEIIDFLVSSGFTGKLYPCKRDSKGSKIISLLIDVTHCLDEIANRFTDLRKNVTVKRFRTQEPVEYFECSLNRTDLLQLLKRNNIVVFNTAEEFALKKQELENQLKIMNQ